jgi:hypothetical protein
MGHLASGEGIMMVVVVQEDWMTIQSLGFSPA